VDRPYQGQTRSKREFTDDPSSYGEGRPGGLNGDYSSNGPTKAKRRDEDVPTTQKAGKPVKGYTLRIVGPDSHGDKVKTLSMLRAREKQRQLFRRICLSQQLHRQTGGLMYVIDSAGNECRTKDDMEQACLQENQSRFDQAADTPFLAEPLFSLIGQLGEGPGTQAILQGVFDIPGISDQMKDLLTHLHQCMTTTEDSFPQFTGDSHREVWSKAKEITSSSAHSQLHFGHYMAHAGTMI